MERERDVLVSPTAEVPVIEGEIVTAIRELAGRGVGKKTIAREVGVAINTVRRYLRQPMVAGQQVRPAARRLTDAGARRRARCSSGRPRAMRSSCSACSPSAASRERAHGAARGRGHATRAARGRRWRPSASRRRRAISCRSTSARSACRLPASACGSSLLVAVLSYSRRLFVKAFLNERGDDWREGIAAAFTHFGGVPRTLLGDNARALVLGPRSRDRHRQCSIRPISRSVATGTCSRAPARPYRARTKGKTEAGVKYVKRNAIADQPFDVLRRARAASGRVDEIGRSAEPRHHA